MSKLRGVLLFTLCLVSCGCEGPIQRERQARHEQRGPLAELAPYSNHAVYRQAVLGAGVEPGDYAAMYPSRATPEKCYTAFRYAWMVGDYDLAFDMLTPRAGREIAANLLGFITLADVLAKPIPGDADEPGGGEVGDLVESLNVVLRRRGIESLGVLYLKHKIEDGPETTPGLRRLNHRKTLIRMAQELGPLDVFVAEAMNAVRDARPNLNRKALEQMGLLYGYIVDIKEVEGRARGWQKQSEIDMAFSVEFVRDDTGWRIDEALPKSNYLRWGGMYRDLNGVIYRR